MGNPMQKVLGSIRKVRFTQPTLRQASIREKKGPSLGKLQVKHHHQRSPHAMKFEDRSHEETEREQRCARNKEGNLSKNKFKLKEKDQVTFYSISGASMHMVSKRDLNSAELDGDQEDIEESDDGDDGQRRGANKRRSNGIRQIFGFIRDGHAS